MPIVNDPKNVTVNQVSGSELMVGMVGDEYIQDTVQVINICTLIDEIFGEDWWKEGYQEINPVIMQWAKDNDVHYYAAPREDFFLWRGVRQAWEAGKTAVLVEDLS